MIALAPIPPAESRNGASWEERAHHLHDGEAVSSEGFNYDAVETEVDLLCEQMSSVKLTSSQAIAVLVWNRRQVADAETRCQATIMARIVGDMLASSNIPMDVACLAMVAGLDQALGLGSMADVARDLDVTRAAICKCAGKWRDTLGFATTKFTRSEQNRKNCSEAQSRDHWRRRKKF